MSRSLILGIDQGTTGSTALLFDPTGGLVAKGYSEFSQHYPQPGWVEHDAEEIWNVTLRVIRQALSQANCGAEDVAAIGITNQRETTVIWEKFTGKPISRAIVWQCRRTSNVCETLRGQGHEKLVRDRTGLVLDPYFSATKIGWLLDHVPEARRRAELGELLFGTIDTWLIWKLTGGRVHATDFTNASRTLLLDIHQKRWSTELCELFRVPMSLLPKVQASASVFGETDASLLGVSIPIAGCAGDQQSALFGHGATEPGQGKCTFGTGAFAMAFVGDQATTSTHGLLTTLACDKEGKPAYAQEGSVFIAGAVIQWLRDGLGLIEKASETEEVAKSVSDTGGVYLVPAFVGLGAPYWDAEARGAIVGLTRGTTRAHLVRAALESMAYQTADLVDAMASDAGKRLTELRVDGGATANNLLMQFLADILQINIVRPEMTEMTGFGAARLAALTKGIWPSVGLAPGKSETFQPKMNRHEAENLLAGWRKAVARVRS